MQFRRRITRAEYEQVKANCAAKINVQMERLQLRPSDVQKVTVQAVLGQQQQASVSMQDLVAYRSCRTLPKGAKLAALAFALKVSPAELVPTPYQDTPLLVQRKVRSTASDGMRVSLEASTAYPGYSWLELRVLLSNDKAYKLKDVAIRQHSIEDMRRRGMTDEEIKATLDHLERGEQVKHAVPADTPAA